MEITTSTIEVDTLGKDTKKRKTMKLTRWFSRRSSQKSPTTESHEQSPTKPSQTDGAALKRDDEKAAVTTSAGARTDPGDGVSGAASNKQQHKDRKDGDEVQSSGERSDDDAAGDEEEDNESDAEDNATRPLRDLWKVAWNSDEVGEKGRATLKGKKKDQESAQALVEGVIKTTELKMASYKARWGSGDEKTALGSARDVLLSALTVKDLIDAGLKFDPTGYGSAAWSVVSFGLTLAQNDKDRADLTFGACGHLARSLALYSRIEAHYWKREVKNGRPLEEAMIRVYVAILVYAAEVQESTESTVAARIRKSFLSLTGQPLEKLKEKVDQEDAEMEKWQKLVDREQRLAAAKKLRDIEATTNNILSKLDDVAKTSSKTLSKVQEEELRELYKWLLKEEGTSQSDTHKKLQRDIDWWKSSARTYGKGKGTSDTATVESSEDGEAQAHKDGELVREDRSEDGDDIQANEPDQALPQERPERNETRGDKLGGWLLEMSEYYSDWKRDPQSLLWLYGNSGCGKSPLCSAIIRELDKSIMKDDAKTKALAYWYFSFDLDDTKKMDLLLVSLLRQLAIQCEGFADDKSLRFFRRAQNSGRLPDSTSELFAHLKRLIARADKDVYIVLDGLDQVPDRQRAANHEPLKLLDIIRRLIRQELPNLHVLLISRDERDVRECLETNLKDMLVALDVTQKSGDDLNRFIEGKLEDMQILRGNPALIQEVKDRLHLEHVSFPWATSVIQQISQCHDTDEVRDALDRLPDGILNIYQAALERIPTKDVKYMRPILRWMLTAKRPLSQKELAAAVGLHSPTAVSEICSRLLVETRRESTTVAGRDRVLDVFSFTHFSVQEYLEAVVSGSTDKLGAISEKVARFVAPTGEDAHLQMTKRCLAIFSACSSSRRNKATAAGNDSDSESDEDASSSGAGDGDGGTTASWETHAEDAASDGSESGDSTTSEAPDSDCLEGPAAKYAAEFWFHHYTEIDRAKKLDKENSKAYSRQLKELDSEICTQFLLDKKKLRFWLKTYDPDASSTRLDTHSEDDDNTPLPVYYAIKLKLGAISVQLVEQLSQSPTDPAATAKMLDQRGREGTALQLAAHQGDSAAMEVLIKYGANVNSERGTYGTALYAAAARGDRDAVEGLLKAGARPEARYSGDLGTALHVAAFRGHEAVVELLLGQGMSINYVDGPFATALQAASASRQYTIIKQLLVNGADPNIVGGLLGTAALAAVCLDGGPDKEILETLRKGGAQYLDEPSFWMRAYNKANAVTFRSNYERRVGPGWVAEVYQGLLVQRSGHGPGDLDNLARLQWVLACAIRQYTLPGSRFPGNSAVFRAPLICRIPFQDQLDAIQQAAPRLELTLQTVGRRDFLYQAFFWAGLNYILETLPSLINQSLDRVRDQLYREYDRRGPSAILRTSPAFPFRWALADYEDRYTMYDEDAWSFRTHYGRGFTQRRRMKGMNLLRYLIDEPRSSRDNDIDHTARSDLVAMELARQRQRQTRLEEAHHWQTLARDTSRAREGRDDTAADELQFAARSGVWVVSDVLDLVRHLLECGDRCIRYQDAVTDNSTKAGYAPRQQTHVEDLTYELFSAVIRLALALSDHGDDLERLAQPVRLLTTVRLERIKQLDALCERELGSKNTCTCNHSHACAESNKSDSMVQEISAAVARQVEQVIGDKLSVAHTGMAGELESLVKGVIKEQVPSIVEQVQQGLVEKVGDEVQRQLAEAQASQPRRGLLWG